MNHELSGNLEYSDKTAWGKKQAIGRTSRNYQEDQLKMILNLAGDMNGKIVLDAGCGYGRLMKSLCNPTTRIIGIDVSELMLKEAVKEAVRGDLCEGSITYLPFVNGVFDVIISDTVLMHLTTEDMIKSLREFVRVRNERGKIIFNVPWLSPFLIFNPRSLIYYTYVLLSKMAKRHNPVYARAYTKRKVRQILNNLGLRGYRIFSYHDNLGSGLLIVVK